jgi:hypothetical protein
MMILNVSGWAFVITNKCNHREYVDQLFKAMYGQKITDRPITSPGGGIVTSGAGEAVVEDRRRHASRRANSTLAISVATHSGRSGIAHVIMNRNDNIMCWKKHQENINTETCTQDYQDVFKPIQFCTGWSGYVETHNCAMMHRNMNSTLGRV